MSTLAVSPPDLSSSIPSYYPKPRLPVRGDPFGGSREMVPTFSSVRNPRTTPLSPGWPQITTVRFGEVTGGPSSAHTTPEASPREEKPPSSRVGEVSRLQR